MSDNVPVLVRLGPESRVWWCPVCQYAKQYRKPPAPGALCPVCQGTDNLQPEDVIDGAFGRYSPVSRRRPLAQGGWWCRVCNSTKWKVKRTPAGRDPLCEVCQRRWAMDRDAAAGKAVDPWRYKYVYRLG